MHGDRVLLGPVSDDREALMRETDRRVNEMQREAARKVTAALGPGPRQRETGIDPFAEGAELPTPVAPSHPDVAHR